MTASKFTVGIIGTGFGARVHAPMFQQHPGFEVKAISSVSRGRSEQVREQTGIEAVYDDWQKMLDEETFDLVAVASAPTLHKQMTLAALDRGAHVLCEKPMAANQEEAQAMIEARNNAGRLGFINFEFRFRPARMKAHDIAASGQLGEIFHVNYRGVRAGYQSVTQRLLGWLGQEDQAGGRLGALGSHMFDSLAWITGSRVASVYGQLQTYVPEATVDGQVEHRTADDAFHTTGTLGSGASFNLSFISPSRANLGTTLEITGSGGTLVVKDDEQVLLSNEEGELEPVQLPQAQQAPEGLADTAVGYYTAFNPMLDALHASLVSGEPAENIATFENGLQVQRVIDAIHTASDSGQVMSL